MTGGRLWKEVLEGIKAEISKTTDDGAVMTCPLLPSPRPRIIRSANSGSPVKIIKHIKL